MCNRVQMEGVDIVKVRAKGPFKDGVGSFRRNLRSYQAEPKTDAVDMGIDREGGLTKAEEQHTGRGLRPNAVEIEQPAAGIVEWH